MVYIEFIIAAITIIVAGHFLVRFSDDLAEITRLGRLFVGSIFLAGATSLPELFVDFNSVLNGMPDLAVGDLYGSSIINLLILAVVDLMHRGTSQIFTRAASRHALASAISITVTAVAGMAILFETRLGGLEVFGLGLGPITIAVIYFLGLRMIFLDQKLAREVVSDVPFTEGKPSLKKAVAGYVVSGHAILIAAPFVSHSAGEIAKITGLGGTFIGTTLVALTTSLPELASTISATRRGAVDMAMGNIFGSNTFNMILLIPLDLAHRGSLLAAVSDVHVFSSLATILITSTAILGQLYQVEGRKKFIEPDALAVIAQVIGALVLIYFLGRP